MAAETVELGTIYLVDLVGSTQMAGLWLVNGARGGKNRIGDWADGKRGVAGA